ncbi:hypothetical protein HG537_0A07420 [Torulaspora globosa]|uniref:Secreted protein n=1 Tax=Torulaspora globosa TaxID=48254 RepID=A0A7H9HQ76_9SACH|nr:hypothetical protein HG537_0A07420 [Torulaspora sp. CBS 2947]
MMRRVVLICSFLAIITHAYDFTSHDRLLTIGRPSNKIVYPRNANKTAIEMYSDEFAVNWPEIYQMARSIVDQRNATDSEAEKGRDDEIEQVVEQISAALGIYSSRMIGPDQDNGNDGRNVEICNGGYSRQDFFNVLRIRLGLMKSFLKEAYYTYASSVIDNAGSVLKIASTALIGSRQPLSDAL